MSALAPLLGTGAVLLGIFVLLYSLGGFIIVQPRTQVVVLRFGTYIGTLTEEGINYVFPLGRQIYRVSSQVISVDLPRLNVLEANGNPIEVSAVCLYQVREAQRAVLEVENAHQFVTLLATATVKNVCSQFPYEATDPNKPCLKKESAQVTKTLESELQSLVLPAGIQILQVRLNDLTYATEIAQSMLQRQQALALVSARRTIVDGAVQTVADATQRLRAMGLAISDADVEHFSSNLLAVLASGERVQPVLSLGSSAGGRL